MKALFALAMIVATSAHAGTYKCIENKDTALSAGRLQYMLILKQMNEITDPSVVKNHDAAGWVKVSILSRDPEEGGQFTTHQEPFMAIGTYEDVMFFATAKKHGFEFNMYMDELDQTSAKIRGVSKRLRLENCTYTGR